MAISVTDLGTASDASGLSSVTLSSVTVPAGALIVVVIVEGVTSTAFGSVTDDAGNSYQRSTGASINNSGLRCAVYYANNAAALSSQNIVYTKFNSSQVAGIACLYATGVDTTSSCEDTAAAANAFSASSGTSFTVTSGVPATDGCLFVAAIFGQATAGSSPTQQSGFATPPDPVAGGASVRLINGGDKIQTGSAAAETYAISWTGSAVTRAAVITAFKASTVGPPTPSTAIPSMLEGQMAVASRKQPLHELQLPLAQPYIVGPATPNGAPGMLCDVSIASKKNALNDLPFAFPPVLPVTPSRAMPHLPDRGYASRKRPMIDNLAQAIFIGPTLFPIAGHQKMPDAPVPSVKRPLLDLPGVYELPTEFPDALPTMPDVAVPSRKRPLLDRLDMLHSIYGPVPPTPSFGIPVMPDLAVASVKRPLLDKQLDGVFYQTTQALNPNIALWPLLDMSVASRKQQNIDTFPTVYFLPTVRATAGFEPLPDVAVPSVKRPLLDLPGVFEQPSEIIDLLPWMPDRAVASRKRPLLESIPPYPQFYQATAQTPSSALWNLPDVSIASRKNALIDALSFPEFFPTLTPAPSTALPSMMEMLAPWASRKQQWLDLPLPILPARPPTPSFAIPMLPDMPVTSRKQPVLDALAAITPFPGFLPPTPSTVIQMMTDMAVASRKQTLQDLQLNFPVKPVLPFTPSTAVPWMLETQVPPASRKNALELLYSMVFPVLTPQIGGDQAMPDVAIASRKRPLLDLPGVFELPTEQPDLIPWMPDRAVASRKRVLLDRLDMLHSIYGPVPPTTSNVIQTMPDVAVASRKNPLIDTIPTPLLYATFAPTPSFALPAMLELQVSYASRKRPLLDLPGVFEQPSELPDAIPHLPDRSVASRKRPLLDELSPAVFYEPIKPATTSNVIQTLPDVSIASRKNALVDTLPTVLYFATLAPRPDYVIQTMADVSLPSRKNALIDAMQTIYFAPTVLATAGIEPLPDVSIASRKRPLIDTIPTILYAVTQAQITSLPIPVLPDVSIKSKKQVLIDVLSPTVFEQPTEFPEAVPHMPDMAIASRKNSLIDVLSPAIFFGPTTFPIAGHQRMLDMAVASRKQILLDVLFSQPINWHLLPPTPSRVIQTMADMAVASRKRPLLDELSPAVFFEGVKPITPSTLLPWMPDVSIASRKNPLIDLQLYFPWRPIPPTTPSRVIQMMADMAVATRQRPLRDHLETFPLFYPNLPRTPSLAIPHMPDMAVASKKQALRDFVLEWLPLIYPTLAPTPNTALLNMPDVAVASRKNALIDTLLTLRSQRADLRLALAMVDVAVPSKGNKRMFPIFENMAAGAFVTLPNRAPQMMPDIGVRTRPIILPELAYLPPFQVIHPPDIEERPPGGGKRRFRRPDGARKLHPLPLQRREQVIWRRDDYGLPYKVGLFESIEELLPEPAPEAPVEALAPDQVQPIEARAPLGQYPVQTPPGLVGLLTPPFQSPAELEQQDIQDALRVLGQLQDPLVRVIVDMADADDAMRAIEELGDPRLAFVLEMIVKILKS